MKVRPGRTLIWLAGVAVASSAAAFMFPAAAAIAPLAFAAGVGLWIADVRWLKRHRTDIVVTRQVPAVVGRGIPFDVVLRYRTSTNDLIKGSLREVAPG